MRRSCWVGTFLILALCGLSVAAVSSSGAGETQVGAQQGPAFDALQEDIDADSVLLSADIRADGDANWRVVYRLELDSDDREAAFEELREDIEADPGAYLDPFENRIRETVETAQVATDREMTATDFGVEVEREQQPQATFGVVTFEYEWAGFAAVDGDVIRAGDAVDRLFLDGDQRLSLSWPQSHQLESSSPTPSVTEQQRVVWRGPLDFDAGQPRIVLTPVDDGFSLVWLIGGGLAVALVLLGLSLWRDRLPIPGTERPPAPTSTTAEQGDEASSSAGTAATEEETQPPPELLSNEEQLLRLVQENGGRMKQKAAAEELDWSAAKTSQVVGSLREDEEIESFRLGRENVLTLPDVDITEGGADETDASGDGAGTDL